MKNKTGPASKKYHFVYKTTCLVNGFIYIGVRSTNKIDDGYIGSGGKFGKAVKLLGKENFTREILEFFNSRDAAEDREEELVDREFLKRKDVYNKFPGGGQFDSTGTITVKDVDGTTDFVSVDDPRYLSGELKAWWCGKGVYTDGKERFVLDTDDPMIRTLNLYGTTRGTVPVTDGNGKRFRVSLNDPRYINGELLHVATGRITMAKIDENGKLVTCSKFKCDPTIETDGWRPLGCFAKHRDVTVETRLRLSNSLKGKMSGDKNPAYGKKWIHNPITGIRRRIDKIEGVPAGWVLGLSGRG